MPATGAVSALLSKNASDLELAQRIAGGDAVAFEAVMRQHNRALYRVARAILRDDTEAEDVLQLGYLHAYQAMAEFRGQSKLSTWLTRIVANEALMRVRQRGREATVIALEGLGTEIDDRPDPPGPAEEQPDALASRAQTRALIERGIDALPEAFRTIFVLRAVEELSVEETAACLGIPEATVRTRFFRARGLLRESIAREIDAATLEAFSFDGARCDRIVVGVLQRIHPPDS